MDLTSKSASRAVCESLTDELHSPHGDCRGVLYLPRCGRPWSQHPPVLGVRLCGDWLCDSQAVEK